MTTDREYIAQAISKVIGGQPLRRFTSSTISDPNHCAQLVREGIEGGLGIAENTWEVAILAHEYRKKAGRSVRWAVDYEAAGKDLGLAKPFERVRIGDPLYWPLTIGKGVRAKAYGHTALYAGVIGGEHYVLENSGWDPLERQRQGARLPLGANSYVFLSPLRLLGPPRTVIYPTSAIKAAETAPIVPPASPPAGKAPDVEYLWAEIIGVDGQPEPGGPVSIPIDRQGRLLVQESGKPKIIRVPESKWRK